MSDVRHHRFQLRFVRSPEISRNLQHEIGLQHGGILSYMRCWRPDLFFGLPRRMHECEQEGWNDYWGKHIVSTVVHECWLRARMLILSEWFISVLRLLLCTREQCDRVTAIILSRNTGKWNSFLELYFVSTDYLKAPLRSLQLCFLLH